MRTLDQQMGSMSFGYRFKKMEYDNIKWSQNPFTYYETKIVCRNNDNDANEV